MVEAPPAEAQPSAYKNRLNRAKTGKMETPADAVPKPATPGTGFSLDLSTIPKEAPVSVGCAPHHTPIDEFLWWPHELGARKAAGAAGRWHAGARPLLAHARASLHPRRAWVQRATV